MLGAANVLQWDSTSIIGNATRREMKLFEGPGVENAKQRETSPHAVQRDHKMVMVHASN